MNKTEISKYLIYSLSKIGALINQKKIEQKKHFHV